jgi:hypothetical protein
MLADATAQWTYPSAPAVQTPYVNVKLAKGVALSKDWDYAEVYIDVSLTKGGSLAYGGWQEIGYVPRGSAQPKLQFLNYGTQPLYVHSAGIIINQGIPKGQCLKNILCPANMAILASLNFPGSPPPGFPHSKFIPLKYPPPAVLKPLGRR